MSNQTVIWTEVSIERRCQCEEGCPISLVGYRKNCKIYPPHRAKYDQKLREQKREARKKLCSRAAQKYHKAHPEFMIQLKKTIHEFEILYGGRPPFRKTWEDAKWEGGFHPNDHWMAWYKKQLQEWKPILKIAWQSRRERWTGG